MERILFTYDPEYSRKSGQFTVVFTPAVLLGGRWQIIKGTRIYYVRDLQAVAEQVPDKVLFRTALESEMAFRKNEGRFFNPDQEFTRLRIASRHLFKFISAAQKQKILLHADGAPTSFRVDKEVMAEISVKEGRMALHLGGIPLAEAQVVVQTMPVTLIQANRIVQMRAEVPFSFLQQIPANQVLAETEKESLLLRFAKQPDKVRIKRIEQEEIRTVKDAVVHAKLSLDERAAKARLYLVYEGHAVKDNDNLTVIVDPHRHMAIHRNRPVEENFKSVLLSHGFASIPERDFNWRAPQQPLESLVPSLENHGFEVWMGDRKIAAPVTVRWDVQTQRHHLRVGATVFSGDVEIGADELFRAFQEGRRYVARPDGSVGLISGEVRRMLAEFTGTGSMQGAFIVFNKADFPSVRACLENSAEVRNDSAFEELCRFGQGVAGVQRHLLPAGFEAVLRPYQILGYNWLRTLKSLGLNGILADDMGLGKSVQVLALIKSLKGEGALGRPFLLIAPKTLLFNWEIEIKKFAPDLAYYLFAGPDRIRRADHLRRHDLILTPYSLVRSETPLLCGIEWEYVILDEAQAIKNADTITSRAVKHLPATARLSITGTPVENSAADLWSQFDFLMPGFLGEEDAFKEAYTDAAKDLQRLRAKTQPYILRRLKSQVLAELPPKTEVTIYCDFGDEQKAIYDQALAAAKDEMETFEGSRTFHILRLILRLRQIACHPRLAVKAIRRSLDHVGSGKTEEVIQAALEILAEGHKILIFSQFTRHLQLIQSLFLRLKITSFYLDGRTMDRGAVVQAFKTHDGPCPFFISLKAGGTGLNLSEASYVFLLDPWWNPAVENQAIDRCHRLGQHQPVTVYRFITRDSIEEKVMALKARKQEIESVLIDASVPDYLPFDETTLKRLITE